MQQPACSLILYSQEQKTWEQIHFYHISTLTATSDKNEDNEDGDDGHKANCWEGPFSKCWGKSAQSTNQPKEPLLPKQKLARQKLGQAD